MPTLLRPAEITVQSATVDSKRWDAYRPRADDIIVATYPKCGTTWTQRIVDLLIFQNAEPREIMANAPWLDCVFMAPLDVMIGTLEAQTHRRSIKSHLPLNALPIYEGVKYIHVARDGRDSCMSMHNHQLGFIPTARTRMAAGGEPPPPVPEDPREFFLQWIAGEEGGGAPDETHFGTYFDFENTYWGARKGGNLLLVHYNDLKADLVGEMARISAFLGIDTPADRLHALAESATFESMKRDGDAILPQLKTVFDRGAERFINKGTNGRWRDVLTGDDVARYLALAKERFSPAHAAWIEHGRLAAGDPEAT
jgi:aryl sulfotransferase